jgi:DNA-binding TFAR19-related protein (PDSD5 family)
MTQQAREWLEKVRQASPELASLLEPELERGVPLIIVRQTLAQLMQEAHPEAFAKYMREHP